VAADRDTRRRPATEDDEDLCNIAEYSVVKTQKLQQVLQIMLNVNGSKLTQTIKLDITKKRS